MSTPTPTIEQVVYTNGGKTITSSVISNFDLKCYICRKIFTADEPIVTITTVTKDFKAEIKQTHLKDCYELLKLLKIVALTKTFQLHTRHAKRWLTEAKDHGAIFTTYLQPYQSTLLNLMNLYDSNSPIFITPTLSRTEQEDEKLNVSTISFIIFTPILKELEIREDLFNKGRLESFWNQVTILSLTFNNPLFVTEQFLSLYKNEPHNLGLFHEANVYCYWDINSDESKHRILLIIDQRIRSSDTLKVILKRDYGYTKDLTWKRLPMVIDKMKQVESYSSELIKDSNTLINDLLKEAKKFNARHVGMTSINPNSVKIHYDGPVETIQQSKFTNGFPVRSTSGQEYLYYYHNAQSSLEHKRFYFLPVKYSTSCPVACCEGILTEALPLYYNDYNSLMDEINLVNANSSNKLTVKELSSFKCLYSSY